MNNRLLPKICTSVLLWLTVLTALGSTVAANDVCFVREEQIDVPSTLPKALVWEVLRTRIWLHSIAAIKNDLLEQRHIAANFSEQELAALAALTHTFSIQNEDRSEDTVTAHLSVYKNAPLLLREATNCQDLLPLVLNLLQESDDRLVSIDRHWPKGRIYTEPLFASQKQRYERLTKENSQRFTDSLAALWTTYKAIAPKDGWLTNANHLMALEEANRIKEHDPVILLLLAECRLLNKLPQQAVESASHALRLEANLDRARYIRALAYWQMRQFGLAENDLSLVLAREPLTKERGERMLPYLRARGSLRLLLGKNAEMCEDFTLACQLGDCDGLQHARAQHLCAPEQ